MASIYYAKINVNKDIYKVYDKKASISEILERLLVADWQEKQYSYFLKEKNDEGKPKKEIVKFIHVDKFFDKRYIIGRLIKIYGDDIQHYDKEKDDLVDLSNDNLARSVAFYFDVKNEIVAFVYKQKFPARQFVNLFQKMINLIFGEDMFIVILKKNHGEFIDKIKKLEIVRSVRISLVPPNSNEKELSNLLPKNDKDLKESNITKIGLEFSAPFSKEGINISTSFFQKLIRAVTKGWGEMTIVGRSLTGRRERITSNINAPFKKTISDSQKDSFETVKETGRAGINELIRN